MLVLAFVEQRMLIQIKKNRALYPAHIFAIGQT